MTEAYWQRQKERNEQEVFSNPQNYLWRDVMEQLKDRIKGKKHYLELYSICKTDNPYIKQIKNSPNITTSTAAELICRDKACELQYCLSLIIPANENRRRIIDLKGCTQQYDTFRMCYNQEISRINKQEELLKRVVEGQITVEDIKNQLKAKLIQQKEVIFQEYI